MVEDVRRLELELQRLPLGDVDALQQAEVPVVDVRQSQRVTASRSHSSRAGHDVLCVGVSAT